jgi:hypothetical protein
MTGVTCPVVALSFTATGGTGAGFTVSFAAVVVADPDEFVNTA